VGTERRMVPFLQFEVERVMMAAEDKLSTIAALHDKEASLANVRTIFSLDLPCLSPQEML